MKIGIMTFYFAHNYGAMLQAMALQEYLKNEGLNATIVPYYPEKFRIQYSINPFTPGMRFKRRIINLLHFFPKYQQYRAFEEFKLKTMISEKTAEVREKKRFIDLIDSFDIVLYGSDQIWNVDLTYKDFFYFGESTNAIKISFAASLGRSTISTEDIDKMGKCLREFAALSVREQSSREIISEVTHKSVFVSCDPVFLNDVNWWKKFECSVPGINRFVLLYLLEYDDKLIELAKKYSGNEAIKLVCIHPTLDIKIPGVELLIGIGPKEFLYLIDNAECVFTNSFHAVSFCSIFRKKMVHKPNNKSPERTIDLLSRWNLTDNSGIYDVDFSELDYRMVDAFVEESKRFLLKNISCQ
ncbi:polysaccharide pyruvyl transferase family protein [Butyrivibrio sp. VCD2006]|uniref:polysaccharide pyruvyl transferase family protein n=1 Tax=Butyrivibrio sp. VCD2006 TaxID=1280664 RepID=UPI000418D487|nr:polysaccharide pyruvyl transferase family protein [Butyrivibrio sp. VCD2006]